MEITENNLEITNSMILEVSEDEVITDSSIGLVTEEFDLLEVFDD